MSSTNRLPSLGSMREIIHINELIMYWPLAQRIDSNRSLDQRSWISGGGSKASTKSAVDAAVVDQGG